MRWRDQFHDRRGFLPDPVIGFQLAEMMKAIVFGQAGDPIDVLKVASIPTPASTEDKVLIDVKCSPIHPADLAFIRGQYRIRPQFPQVAGLEGLGTVVDAAAGSTFGIGTRVAFRWPGSWAERVTVPTERLVEVPAEISDAAACQFSLNPVTAWGLLDEAGVGEGDCVLLTAAASTVSNLVGAIARNRGIGVIGLVRGEATDASHRCTAEHVVSLNDPDVVEKIEAAAGGRQLSALIDSVGGPRIPSLFKTLAAGARIIAYGVQELEPALVTNAMLIYSNLTWKGFGIDRWLSQYSTEATAAMRDELWRLISNGAMKLPIASIHGLDSIEDALAANANRGRDGKVILAIRPVPTN